MERRVYLGASQREERNTELFILVSLNCSALLVKKTTVVERKKKAEKHPIISEFIVQFIG